MRYVLSASTKKFVHKIAQIPGVKKLLKPLWYPVLHWMQERRNREFRRHALNVLKRFDEALTKGGFEYTLAFGTMLGAVREKGFIKHDHDIDTAMWASDWSPRLRQCLADAGFKIWRSFLVDDGECGREETYVYKNVSIDVFYFYPAINTYPYCCDFVGRTPENRITIEDGALPRRLELPMARGRKLTKFEDTELYIPVNSEEILAFRYGESWRIPNPKWNMRSYDEHITEWPEKLGVYSEY